MDLIKKNEEHIKNLTRSLDQQIEKYNQAHKLPEPSIEVEEDADNVRENFLDFCNHSKDFVDSLVEIKKNTILVINSFPNLEGWLGPQKEDDWDNFIIDLTGKPKRHE